MSDRKLYWQNRLSNRDMRVAWWRDLESLGLFADVRATDANHRTDEQGTHYLIGRRSVAIEEFDEVKRLCPQLLAEGFTECFAPPGRKEKDEDAA